jgi:nitrite reductase (NADH) small subunit
MSSRDMLQGMSQCTRIGSAFELPPEAEAREFPFGSRTVCVANGGGKFAALGNVCPHKGGPLSEGSIVKGNLVCPWHGWEFRLSDGRCTNRPGASVEVFDLVIHGEDVFLKS